MVHIKIVNQFLQALVKLFWTVKSTPLTLTLNWSSKDFSVIDPSGIKSPKPAFANKIFNFPFSFSIISMVLSISVNLPESAWIPVTFFLPSCWTAVSRTSLRRPVIKT